jgi:hypothetical protein
VSDRATYERDGLVWAVAVAGWGMWALVPLDSSISDTYDVMEAVSSLRLQGAALAIAGLIASGLWWRGRARSLAAALTIGCWVWIWVGMMLGEWRSTATYMYGLTVAWSGWVYWRALRVGGRDGVG